MQDKRLNRILRRWAYLNINSANLKLVIKLHITLKLLSMNKVHGRIKGKGKHLRQINIISALTTRRHHLKGLLQRDLIQIALLPGNTLGKRAARSSIHRSTTVLPVGETSLH